MGFHFVQVDVVVEFDDVDLGGVIGFGVERHLDVDPRDAVRLRDIDLPAPRLLQPALIDLLVAVNDVLELDVVWRPRHLSLQNSDLLAASVNLANTVNRAHDELVQMSAE